MPVRELVDAVEGERAGEHGGRRRCRFPGPWQAVIGLLPGNADRKMYTLLMAVPLTEARARLGELVSQARHGHEPVTLTDHGKPVAAIIGAEELADLQDWAAVARHEADKAAGCVTGVTDDELDAALDRYEAGAPWA